MASSCPPDSFSYNSTAGGLLCACDPGRYLTPSGSCALPPAGDFVVHSSLDEHSTFLTTILSFGVVRRFTEVQAVLLWATSAALVAWILFSAALRLAPLRGGSSVWFRLRFWITRLDVAYATHHWLSDREVVRKRKTELGGTCSIASWLLFIGLLSSILHQFITRRTIEVHRVRPFNGPDLLLFDNDMEFNITTISNMSCSQLRGLDTVVSGTPGFIDHRVYSLSAYANYFCHNTSSGPTISIRCSNCRFPLGIFYISWQFVDLPRNPAAAVAFQFNLTTRDHHDIKRLSFVSGTLKSGNYANDIPKTFRGTDVNILKIHLLPHIYHNLNNLSIIQPLVNDFLPGSFFTEASRLKASFEDPSNGSISTTLYLRFLSDYIVEVDKEKILGPVGFLANVGGVYALSAAIFLFLMLQCERQHKKLLNEENTFRNILRKRRAQRNWDKLRKYVIYTWGCKGIDEGNASSSQRRHVVDMPNCLRGTGSLKKGHLHRNAPENGKKPVSINNAIP